MLLNLLALLILTSNASTYVFTKFSPLTYFGASSHKSQIEHVSQSLEIFEKKLQSFYTDYYQYTNLSGNVISSTKLKRPDTYLSTNLEIDVILAALKDNIRYLKSESDLKVQSLELYSLPELSRLSEKEQSYFQQNQKEILLSAKKHLSLILYFSDKLNNLLIEIESLVNHTTQVNKKLINHQPLSERRRRTLENQLREIAQLKQRLTVIERSSSHISQATSAIEKRYKESLGKNFGFLNSSNFNDVVYKHVNSHLFSMYRDVKADSTSPTLTSNPFIVRRYELRLSQIINNLEAIITFSHDQISIDEHRIFRELRDELKKRKKTMVQERSLFPMVGFLARYYSPESDPYQAAKACYNIFK